MLFRLKNKSMTIGRHGPRRVNTIRAQWAESDPDLAIGISVCSHIITRADGYKFTSNTMAIQHRDIIKVMPIAPLTMQNECPMPLHLGIQKYAVPNPDTIQIALGKDGVCSENSNEA